MHVCCELRVKNGRETFQIFTGNRPYLSPLSEEVAIIAEPWMAWDDGGLSCTLVSPDRTRKITFEIGDGIEGPLPWFGGVQLQRINTELFDFEHQPDGTLCVLHKRLGV
jgi:hypothetical protein